VEAGGFLEKVGGSKKQTGGFFSGGELMFQTPRNVDICCHEMRFENLKCVKMRLRPGLRPGLRWGAYSAPQTPIADRTFVVLFAEVV